MGPARSERVIKLYADPVLDPENELPLPIPPAERPYITLVKHGTNQETWVAELPDAYPNTRKTAS